jgi:hypothetical protein
MRIDHRNHAPLEGQGNRTRAGYAVLPACYKRKLAAQACGEAPSPGGGAHMRLPCSPGEMFGRDRWEHS